MTASPLIFLTETNWSLLVSSYYFTSFNGPAVAVWCLPHHFHTNIWHQTFTLYPTVLSYHRYCNNAGFWEWSPGQVSDVSLSLWMVVDNANTWERSITICLLMQYPNESVLNSWEIGECSLSKDSTSSCTYSRVTSDMDYTTPKSKKQLVCQFTAVFKMAIISSGFLKYSIFRWYCISLPTCHCHEDGVSKHLWNTGKYLPDYIVQHTKRQSPSFHIHFVFTNKSTVTNFLHFQHTTDQFVVQGGL
jgi:hypothetical protein